MKIVISIVLVVILSGIFLYFYSHQKAAVEVPAIKPDFNKTKTQIADNLKRVESAINKYIEINGFKPEKPGDVDFSNVLNVNGNPIKKIEFGSDDKNLIYVTISEAGEGEISGKQIVLEADESLYKKDIQGFESKVIPVIELSDTSYIHEAEIRGVQTDKSVKTKRNCRCEFEEENELPLCSELQAYSALFCSQLKSQLKPEPVKPRTYSYYSKFRCYSVDIPLQYMPDQCNTHTYWHSLLAQRQEQQNKLKQQKEQQLLAQEKALADATQHAEDERKAYELRRRERDQNELDFWVPDDVPKILYKTNTERWRSATLLSLPFSEGPMINDDLRKEIFHALSLIQERYNEVKNLQVYESYRLSNLIVILTPQGEKIVKPVRITDNDHKEFDPLNTGISELDELNKKYDVISLNGDTFIKLEFRKPLNLDHVIKEYKSINEYINVFKNDTVGGPDTNIFLKDKGEQWEFAFSRGWGDCPSGCIHFRYFIFLFDRVTGKITKLEEKGDPLPADT